MFLRTLPSRYGRLAARLTLLLALTGSIAACPGASSGLSGVYEARHDDESMRLEFKSGHKVDLTMRTGGSAPETVEGDYVVNGNQVTIQVPNGFPLTLVRDGKTLSASMFGETLHFEKR